MAHISDEQERALVNGVERLAYSMQVLASRLTHEAGDNVVREVMGIAAEVNERVAAAFPHVMDEARRDA